MAAAGTLAAAAYAFGPIALIFTAVVFLVGWSRIQLKVHNFAQVITGILLAFLSTYIQMFFIVNWFK